MMNNGELQNATSNALVADIWVMNILAGHKNPLSRLGPY